MAEVLETVDIIASPTTAQVATTIAAGLPALKDTGFVVADGLYNLLRLYALIGIPAVSIPCGFSPDGLPMGMSLAARANDDETVFRVADAYERATEWTQARPPVG